MMQQFNGETIRKMIEKKTGLRASIMLGPWSDHESCKIRLYKVKIHGPHVDFRFLGFITDQCDDPCEFITRCVYAKFSEGRIAAND